MSKLNWKAALTVCGLCLTAQHNPAWGQTRPDNVSKEVELEEIVVSSTRIGNKGSLSNSKVDGSELQETNMGENLPYLLQRTPSLVVTSDDGLGIGYVYFRVRGTDQSRINMTINGVPLNDSESQSVFWVNMTDMVGSMGSLDVQRGVGTSTNGAAAFGVSALGAGLAAGSFAATTRPRAFAPGMRSFCPTKMVSLRRLFACLHATAQVLQPMQRRVSITIP